MKLRSLPLLLFILTLFFSSESCFPEEEIAKKVEIPCSSDKPQTSNPTGSGALIVTDISGSMQGFAIEKSTQLFTLHELLERSIRDALFSVDPKPSIKRCNIGENLNCESPFQLPKLNDKKSYSASQSRLDFFFTNQASNQNNKNSTKKSPATIEDSLNPYRISVLVTDGMQAKASYTSADSPCLGGADPGCISYLLKEKIEQGYGIWLSILILPFNGTHYAERPLDSTQWDKIQKHIADLPEDPHFKGSKFEIPERSPNIPFVEYKYKGVKPIMVLSLSKDISAGRSFINKFSELLKKETLISSNNGFFALELAPLDIKTAKIKKISLQTKDFVDGVRTIESKHKEGFYDYLVECDRNATANFNIEVQEKSADLLLQNGPKVNFELLPCEGKKYNLPAGKLSISPKSNNSYEAQLSCKQLKEGYYEAWFKLEAIIQSDDTENFWSFLNADNTYESPERLFGLHDIVDTVLKKQAQEKHIKDYVLFRIERK